MPRNRVAPAATTTRGSTVGAFTSRVDISLLLKIDSAVETKMEAPRSWKTVLTLALVHGRNDSKTKAVQ